MKTILYILGGLFILSKLNLQGVTVAGSVTTPASNFGTTPAGGGAGVIAPANDPYANLANAPGGAGGGVPDMSGIATNGANIGSHFGFVPVIGTGNEHIVVNPGSPRPTSPIINRGVFRDVRSAQS